jgi:phosphoribosylformimino-5-aminoimidazole carboxamide ribotide isomerase
MTCHHSFRGALIEVIPAVDIRGGCCVRLYQGDYNKETVFSEDPVGIAMKWQSAGAPRLHVIDLDGAATGELQNLTIIKELAGSALIPVQVGGGIRDMETVKELLQAGVERVVLGTAAVEDTYFVREACRNFGESLIIGVDARDGLVAIRGWKQDTGIRASSIISDMMKLGVRRFIYTDINRDGTLTEPNFDAVFKLVNTFRAPIIASGGVSSLNHLKMLKQLGVEGAIVGRALYSGDINLKKVLSELGH